ncbi:unnamed protein product [Dicrocoelium dendriticum]|nr:unnamed protein product [Dicrocoelium dendriticum]
MQQWLLIALLAVQLKFLQAFNNNVMCSANRCFLEYREWVILSTNGYFAAKRVANCMGLEVVSKLLGHKDMYLIRVSSRKKINHSRHLRCLRGTSLLWMEEQIPLKRVKRSANPVRWNDPLYPEMWYILRGIQKTDYDMNVLEAWSLGYTGKGVVLTIMDDGIDYNHTDLRQNYDPKASYDLNDGDSDPMPNMKDSKNNKHGTRCAGQIAAEGNNSVCMVGIAYNARIGGIRMLDGYITDRLESDTLSFRNDYIQIYSGSWGPEDNGKLYEGPGVLAQSAFQHGVASGRHGFGNIYVWASGNGGIQGDSCAADGYASSPFTLSVSGVGERNGRPWYLEQCSSTLVTTYSSGAHSEKMIVTLDPQQKCTDTHTGTSASAPMAAAIIALLLEANPRLGWRDVQYVTLMTPNPHPFIDGNFTRNAVGRQYSQLYGYGLMDAGKMVRLGELWRGLPPHHRCTSKVGSAKLSLLGFFNHTLALNFSGCVPPPRLDGQSYTDYLHSRSEDGSPVRYLEHVQLYADIDYQRRGLLQITMISPSGTETVLQPPRILDEHSGNIGLLRWPLTTVQLWGESAIGTWHIRLDNIDGFHKIPSWPRPDLDTLRGYWRSAWFVAYGTDEFPIRLRPPRPDRLPPMEWFAPFERYVVNDSDWYAVFTCHLECAAGGCTGPGADQCLGGCRNFATQTRQCVATCPPGTTPYGALRVSLSSDATDGIGNRLRSHVSPSRLRSSWLKESSSHATGNVVCQPCWTLCAACVRPHTEYDCTACSNDYYLVPLITPQVNRARTAQLFTDLGLRTVDSDPPTMIGTCRAECPPGLYPNKTSFTCNLCISHCAECTGPGTGECTSCKHGYRLVHGRCVDAVSVDGRCPSGHYVKQSHCVSCDSACMHDGCLQHGFCVQCKSGYNFLLNGTCSKACPPSWYAGSAIPNPYPISSTTPLTPYASTLRPRRCHPCPPGCTLCSSWNKCLSCLSGLELKHGRCINSETRPNCSPECATCFPGPQQCLRCTPPHHLVVDEFVIQTQVTPSPYGRSVAVDAPSIAQDFYVVGTHSYACTKACPRGSYLTGSGEESVCRACPQTCATCLDEAHCSSCRPPFYLEEQTASCVLGPTCRQTEYFDTDQRLCFPCDGTCSSCTGPLDSDCTSCSVHGASPRCLHPLTTNIPQVSMVEMGDPTASGSCIPCCSYDAVLLSRTPSDCMFCIADQLTCLSGVEISAGEGLWIDQKPTSPDSQPGWLASEPSKLALFAFLLIFLSFITFLISIPLTRFCRNRLYLQTSETAAWRRRRRRKDGCSSSPVNGDGTQISLKQGDALARKCNSSESHTKRPFWDCRKLTSLPQDHARGENDASCADVDLCTTYSPDELCDVGECVGHVSTEKPSCTVANGVRDDKSVQSRTSLPVASPYHSVVCTPPGSCSSRAEDTNRDFGASFLPTSTPVTQDPPASHL